MASEYTNAMVYWESIREQVMQAAIIVIFTAIISWIFITRILPAMYPGL